MPFLLVHSASVMVGKVRPKVTTCFPEKITNTVKQTHIYYEKKVLSPQANDLYENRERVPDTKSTCHSVYKPYETGLKNSKCFH